MNRVYITLLSAVKSCSPDCFTEMVPRDVPHDVDSCDPSRAQVDYLSSIESAFFTKSQPPSVPTKCGGGMRLLR